MLKVNILQYISSIYYSIWDIYSVLYIYNDLGKYGFIHVEYTIKIILKRMRKMCDLLIVFLLLFFFIAKEVLKLEFVLIVFHILWSICSILSLLFDIILQYLKLISLIDLFICFWNRKRTYAFRTLIVHNWKNNRENQSCWKQSLLISYQLYKINARKMSLFTSHEQLYSMEEE